MKVKIRSSLQLSRVFKSNPPAEIEKKTPSGIIDPEDLP